MRVFVAECRQESNSFNPVPSSLAFWDKSGRYEGEAMRRALSGKPCAIGGMLRVLEKVPDAQIVCGLAMSCQSGGPAEQEVLDFFLGQTLPLLAREEPFDLILLSVHGAMQTTRYDDAEGEIVAAIRQTVGPGPVISLSTDLHAFISEKVMANVTCIAGYHTYPHVDYFATGERAATLGLAALRKETRPYTACVHLPLLLPASVYNTLDGVFKELMDYGLSLVAGEKLLDFSLYPMQPWLDVANGASCVLAVATTPEAAKTYARDLATRFWEARHRFSKPLHSIEEVIALAQTSRPDDPVILVDSADSCNAGSTGDSMAVAKKILELGPELKAATVVNDAPAADLAQATGVGNKALFTLGGSQNPAAEQIQALGHVRSLHDGFFTQEGPAGRGVVNNIGPSAVIRVGKLDIVVCRWMAGNGDLQLYRAFGIEPTLYDLVVVKACTSFRAGYSRISTRIYETDTPGAAPVHLRSLHFTRLPRDMYPWMEREDFAIHDARLLPEAGIR